MFFENRHTFFLEVLNSVASNRLTQIEHRRDFYLWYYHQTSSKGLEIRWPFAAYLVADAVVKLATHDYFIGNNSLELFFRVGNQVIFDDVLPKLKDAFECEDLGNAEKAVSWDAKILFEEQHLIQPLYQNLSKINFEIFSDISKNKNSLVFLGRLLYGAVYLKEVRINQGLSVPSFPDNWSLSNHKHRFYYGMVLADFFCNRQRDEGISYFVNRARSRCKIEQLGADSAQERLILDMAHQDYANSLFKKAKENYPLPKELDSKYVLKGGANDALEAVDNKRVIHILTTVLTDFFIDDGEIVLIETCLEQIRKNCEKGNRIAIEILENDRFYLRRISSLSHRVNKDIIKAIRHILSVESIKTYEKFISSLRNVGLGDG